MKKAIAGAIFFIFVMLFSFVMHFPKEALVKYYLYRMEKGSGVSITYSEGKYGFSSLDLKDVQIQKADSKLFDFDRLGVNYSPFGTKISAARGKGTLEADLKSSQWTFDIQNMLLFDKSTKFFKKASLTGKVGYKPGAKTGDGRVSIDLKDPLDEMLKTDVTVDGDLRINSGELSYNITNLTGKDLKGTGMVVLTFDPKDFGSSRLSGTINVESQGTRLNIKISGTINKPDATPSLARGGSGGYNNFQTP